MAKKQISKVSDKLQKINDSFSVNIYDNGFMLEVYGKDHGDDHKSVKIIVSTVDQLIALVTEVAGMERDE